MYDPTGRPDHHRYARHGGRRADGFERTGPRPEQPNGVVTNISYRWQVERNDGTGDYINIPNLRRHLHAE